MTRAWSLNPTHYGSWTTTVYHRAEMLGLVFFVLLSIYDVLLRLFGSQQNPERIHLLRRRVCSGLKMHILQESSGYWHYHRLLRSIAVVHDGLNCFCQDGVRRSGVL